MTQFAGFEKSSVQIGGGAAAEFEGVTTGAVAEVLITSFITRSIGIFAIFDCEKTVVETVKTQTNSKNFFIVSFLLIKIGYKYKTRKSFIDNLN